MTSHHERYYIWQPYVIAGESLSRHVDASTDLPDALDRWADVFMEKHAHFSQIIAKIKQYNQQHPDEQIQIDVLNETLVLVGDQTFLDTLVDDGLVRRLGMPSTQKQMTNNQQESHE